MRNFVLTALLLSTPCHAFAQAKAGKAPPTIGQINDAMQAFVDKGEISGAVTLVGRRGKIVHLGAVGLADIETNKPMKKFALFSIASMTKPVVATAVMILQDEGKLTVDDKVSKYIPAFANGKLASGDMPKREITIRDCLTHTAGLAGPQIFQGSLKEAVDELAGRPLAFEPGEKWQYSPGLNVAGRIVEIVSGQPLQDFLKTRLFKPLGMQQTTFFPSKRQIKRVATLYGPGDADNSLQPEVGFLGDLSKIQAPNPSGGLISNARDMYRFYRMVLSGGKFRKKRVVSASAIKQMTSPQTGDLETGFTPGNCWGLGWCIVREPQGVSAMLSEGTFGHGGAFGTQGWVDPKTETIYVLMIQRIKLKNSDNSEMRRTFQLVASENLN